MGFVKGLYETLDGLYGYYPAPTDLQLTHSLVRLVRSSRLVSSRRSVDCSVYVFHYGSRSRTRDAGRASVIFWKGEVVPTLSSPLPPEKRSSKQKTTMTTTHSDWKFDRG